MNPEPLPGHEILTEPFLRQWGAVQGMKSYYIAGPNEIGWCDNSGYGIDRDPNIHEYIFSAPLGTMALVSTTLACNAAHPKSQPSEVAATNPEGKTCSVCNWTNSKSGVLNLGSHGWICHGCIQRHYDQISVPATSPTAGEMLDWWEKEQPSIGEDTFTGTKRIRVKLKNGKVFAAPTLRLAIAQAMQKEGK